MSYRCVKAILKKIPIVREYVERKEFLEKENRELLETVHLQKEELVFIKEQNSMFSSSIQNKEKEIERLLQGAKENKIFFSREIELLQAIVAEKDMVVKKSEEIIKKNNVEIEHLYIRLENLQRELETEKTNSIKVADYNSSFFWENLYRNGGNSGTGSYNKLAEFKAEMVDRILSKYQIRTVIELGCGDGNQLSCIGYKDYTGVDVSKTIIERNRERFSGDASKRFFTTEEREKYIYEEYDLAISMDVIFHLLEQDVFENYMKDLFFLSKKIVVIYSSNHEEYTKWSEYRHRNFTGFVNRNFPFWKLVEYIPNKYPYTIGFEENTSSSDFYIYMKESSEDNLLGM